jgi:CBS domain-containing protein
MAVLTRSFEAAREATKAAFHVRLIGTFEPDLVCAPVDAIADAWLDTAPPDFDQFPVRDADRTLGLLVRGDCPGRLVRDAMLPLSEELIVSADMAIAELIPRMRTLPCRLILRGDRIDGLVTHSDLLKLPVRIVVFGLLTHLEMVMADLVSTHWPADEWLTALGPGRRAKLLEKETVLRQRGLNPPRIELTEFADKRDLCKRLLAGGRTRFDREMDELRNLRDQLAHAATFVDDAGGSRGIGSLVDQWDAGRYWVRELMVLTQKESMKTGARRATRSRPAGPDRG